LLNRALSEGCGMNRGFRVFAVLSLVAARVVLAQDGVVRDSSRAVAVPAQDSLPVRVLLPAVSHDVVQPSELTRVPLVSADSSAIVAGAKGAAAETGSQPVATKDSTVIIKSFEPIGSDTSSARLTKTEDARFVPPAEPRDSSAALRRYGDSNVVRKDAVAPRIPTVAIMPLEPNGVDSASAKVMTDALSDELLRSGKVRLMERSQMDQILKEQGFQSSGACDGSECAVRVGRLLGIEKIVVGSLGKIGAAYVLSIRAVDVATGEVLAGARKQQVGALENVLTELLPPLAQEIGIRLAGGVPARDSSAGRVVTAAAVPDSSKQKDAVKGNGGNRWVWWAVGGVAIAGGTVAALILSGSRDDAGVKPAASAPSGNVPTDPGTSTTDLSWKGTVSW
jgi:curli biogenesis system outer membrane secretion channel CsgG